MVLSLQARLVSRPRVVSPDAEEVTQGLRARLFAPDLRFRWRGNPEARHVWLNSADIGSSFGLSWLGVNGPSELVLGGESAVYVVAFRDAGVIDLADRDNRHHLSGPSGLIINPGRRFFATTDIGMATCSLGIRADVIASRFAALVGHPSATPLRFDLVIETSNGALNALRLAILAEAERLEQPSPRAPPPLLAAELERLAVSTLLIWQPHSGRFQIDQPVPPSGPRYIRLIEEYIEAHAHEPLQIEDLARISGVSARALFASFRKYRNTTPLLHLRHQRLLRIRAELAAAPPGTITVAETARRWGFLHPGHFARYYQQTFGESPSDTLQR